MASAHVEIPRYGMANCHELCLRIGSPAIRWVNQTALTRADKTKEAEKIFSMWVRKYKASESVRPRGGLIVW